MKTIILTIKPWHLDKIVSKKKLWEIRKTTPMELPVKVLCCPSGSGGKIVAEFIVRQSVDVFMAAYDEEMKKRMCRQACVSVQDAYDYAGKGISKPLRFWKVEDVIDYYTTRGYMVKHISDYGLDRVPQSWCYAKENSD